MADGGPEGGKGPIVLVVDDEPALRLLYRVNLELEGYRILEAGTVAEARAALEAQAIAVVLLDMQLGAERSDVLLQELRDREPRIPVVVVTGSSDIDTGDRTIEADAVIGKPFTIEELTSAVQAVAAFERNH